MRHEFVDRFCRTLPEAQKDQPFGPDTVVWKIHGHMFAAYTETGAGLSVRTAGMSHALAMIRRSRPASAPYLTGGGWVLLPWETPPEELRARLRESYDLVFRDWPTATSHKAAPDDAP
jgi:predicted DNA-binding protein (MmcQ/YjbR family)